MSDDWTDTNEFLAVHYPNVDKALLQGLNQEIGDLKQINGGNADIFIKLRNALPEFLDSTRRIMFGNRRKRTN